MSNIIEFLDQYRKELDEKYKDLCKGRHCNSDCDNFIEPDGCEGMKDF